MSAISRGVASATLLQLLLLGSLCWRVTTAQITVEATCLPGLALFNNSRGQTPCQVGAYLGGQCNGGQFDVSELPPGKFYTGPQNASISTPCYCSTIMYSVMCACAACQNASNVDSWSSWNAFCPSVYVMEFPKDIPLETSVPAWAYLNVTATNFDPQAALSDHGPESSATPSQTATSSTGSSTQGSQGKESSSSSNTGAIVGAVLGSVGGLALIGGAAFFLYRRNWRKYAHVKVYSDKDDPDGPEDTELDSGRLAQKSPFATNANASYYAPALPVVQTNSSPLYNPNDHTTYPTSMSPEIGDYNTRNISQTHVVQPSSGLLNSDVNAEHSGYRGMPEI
ncbi:hypothetical protein DFH11DRAFT_1582038 [Phellopilus nigrolimitatus]|nr:hypothetical protein DFH11DRAFT_1582038 [Phellopilus nigrolimitatus]